MISTEAQEQVLQIAQHMYSSNGMDWATFYREILGVAGVVRRMFPTREALEEFEKSEAYAELQKLLARLRDNGPLPKEDDDPTQVITVRLPQSLHAALKRESRDLSTSMNKLCISKLLQAIDGERVPNDMVNHRRGDKRPAQEQAVEVPAGEI